MFINIKGKKVHFVKEGRGEPILFLHGWGGSIESLKGISDLAKNNYQVIRPSLPGFGLSDLPNPNWGTKEYADIILSFIKSFKFKKIILFGHSFGGSLGIYLAAQYPGLIDKLILCAPSFKREVKKSKGLVSRLPQPLRIIFYRIFFPQSDLWRFPRLESNFRKIVTEDMTSYLAKIKAKTLIIWGDLDKQTPVKGGYELKERINNSLLKIFPDVGHGLPLKKPELVFNEMKSFI